MAALDLEGCTSFEKLVMLNIYLRPALLEAVEVLKYLTWHTTTAGALAIPTYRASLA